MVNGGHVFIFLLSVLSLIQFVSSEKSKQKVKVLVPQWFWTLSDPKDCSPPGSSVHRIIQARILGWVDISFYRGSSGPRDQSQVSCIAGSFFIIYF